MVAKKLSIPLSSVKVKPTSNLVAPNNSTTGGSMGSECLCSAAEFACADLKDREEPNGTCPNVGSQPRLIHFRMDKVKTKMRDPDPTWLDVVGECYRKGVSLTASHM